MNIKDMHIAFQIDLDKALSHNMPDFDPYQIDYFLNNAYINLINIKFTGNNTLKQGFEESIKRISDLQKLITNVTLKGTQLNMHSLNEISFDLSSINNIMYPISSVYIYGKNKMSQTEISNHDNSKNLRADNNNKPWIPIPVCIYENDKVLVYVDPDDIDIKENYPKLTITYLRRPERLNYFSTSGESYTPIVDEHLHKEIVALAVLLAIENIESQRIQTFPNLVNNKE